MFSFGWPEHCSVDLKSFSKHKLELSTLNGCIIYGSRVLIPSQGRQQMLAELHQAHPGVNRMKSLARMYFWWPGLTKDIEKLDKECAKCQENQSNPAMAPLEPWTWPTRPWARVHVNYAGPFMNSMFFIVTDAHSKWVKIMKMSSRTSTATVQMLRTMFAHYGLPRTLVSDNGTCFTSQEFEDFLKANSVQHIKTAPYHPKSNGLAERMAQTFKKGMKKIASGTVDTKLAQFLFSYRITPHSTTGQSLAELMFGRQLSSRFDLLHSNLQEKVLKKQDKQKKYFDRSVKERKFSRGDDVYI